jgi:hypothetical protein
MTLFQFESEAAYESAIHDYCVEHGRNPECNWDDLDEIFSENDDFDDFTEYDPFQA